MNDIDCRVECATISLGFRQQLIRPSFQVDRHQDAIVVSHSDFLLDFQLGTSDRPMGRAVVRTSHSWLGKSADLLPNPNSLASAERFAA
jgi:hypothetical protein